jgi:copper transport protein
MWPCGERARPRRGVALAGGLLLLVLSAQPASAHALLVDSDPASGATAATTPRVVRLWFSEDIAPRFGTARLVDRDGRPVGGTRVVPQGGDPRLLTLELPALQSGAYGVLWQVLAERDGHTTSGMVVFTVGDGARPATIATPVGQAVARPADVARRWVGVCLLAGLIGALAVAGLVLGRAASRNPTELLAVAIGTARRRLLVLAACCAVLGVATGVADLIVQAARQAPAAGGPRAALVPLLTATRWGQLWLVREAALLAVVVLALRLRPAVGRRRLDELGSAAAAGVLVLAIVSVEAMGSHAAALEQARAAAVAADAVHILTACLWLGALPALVVMMWPQRWGGAGPADLLMASRGVFTGLAATSIGLVVLTGLYSAGLEVDTVDGLLRTPYGRALLVKSTLLLVVGGLGLVNAARLHGWSWPWLGAAGRQVAARWPSRRLVVVEATVGGLLLVAVGVLLETVPARGPAATAAPAATVAAPETASASVADLAVTVSATPNRPGMNGFTVLAASSRRPPPAPVEGVTLELAGDGGTSTVELQPVAPGRWFGTARLDQSGRLRVAAVVRRDGKRLAAPVSWWVGSQGPAQRVVTAPAGRRLAPYLNGMALSLLAGAFALGAGRLLVTRRRRHHAAATATRRPERLLEVVR